MRGIVLITFILWASLSLASSTDYYELQEVSELTEGKITGDDLMRYVAQVSNRNFQPLGYKRGAKPAIFGYIHLEEDEKGYFVKDVYCNYKIRKRVGPRRLPNNNTMNTEHTWPQSKGSKREPFRGDIHHLFPTDSRANSQRGNYPFGEVDGRVVSPTCTASRVGHIVDPETGKTTGIRGYEPPLEHRGNVARALFYSASFYKKRIRSHEEYYLKKWHKEDPVDAEEIRRNDLVEEVQGNRNPYIDFPDLVERIEDF